MAAFFFLHMCTFCNCLPRKLNSASFRRGEKRRKTVEAPVEKKVAFSQPPEKVAFFESNRSPVWEQRGRDARGVPPHDLKARDTSRFFGIERQLRKKESKLKAARNALLQENAQRRRFSFCEKNRKTADFSPKFSLDCAVFLFSKQKATDFSPK
jgi:hypothetical protein